MATLYGFISIVIWSTIVALSRRVTESLGPLNAAFYTFLFSGVVVFFIAWIKEKKCPLAHLKNLDLSYSIRVGFFFVLYMVLFYIAVGEVQTRKGAILVGIINYLWPALIFIFALPILKSKANYLLLFTGILLCLASTLYIVLRFNPMHSSDYTGMIAQDWKPLVYVFIAAVSWAIYSNMTNKHKIEANHVYISVFFFVSSLAVLCIILMNGDFPYLTLDSTNVFELVYLIVFPSSTAYLFWDIAMKFGNKNLVVSVSFFIPISSTFVSSLYLNVNLELDFWIGAFFVAAGAMLCYKSMLIKGVKSL